MRLKVVLFAVGLLLAACNFNEVLAPDPEAQKVAMAVYDNIARGEIDAVFSQLPPQYDTPQQRRMFAALREVIPTGPGQPAEMIGINKNTGTGGQTQVQSYRIDYGVEAVGYVATFVRMSDKEPWRLEGVNLSPAPANYEGLPSFSTWTAPPAVRAEPAAAPRTEPADS